MKPPLFTSDDFATANDVAQSSGKFLLVDATASWCGPCRHMDRTTWIDDTVVATIDVVAVAFQLDVDADQELAERLQISAMPTIIAFRNGEEVDRIIGYRGPEALVEWLRAVTSGLREIDLLRERVRALGDLQDDTDANAVHALARELVPHGEFGSAARLYVWLWDKTVSGALQPAPQAPLGTRCALLLRELESLVAKHEPARELFVRRRDEVALRVGQGSANQDEALRWLYLNLILADATSTLSWLQKERDSIEDESELGILERVLFQALIDDDRWADAGRAVRDPAGQALRWLEMLTRGLPPEVIDRDAATHFAVGALNEIGHLYAASLAAGRDGEAGQIAAEVRRVRSDVVTSAYLVSAAVRATTVTAEHLDWLTAGPVPDSTDRKELDQLIARVERLLEVR
jgi:thioredoxin 1